MTFNKYFFGFLGAFFLSVFIFNLASADSASGTINYYKSSNDSNPTTNSTGLNPSTHWNAYVSVTLPSDPAGSGSTISDLSLTCTVDEGGSITGNVYKSTRVTTSSVNWNTYDGVNNWTSSGGDYGALLDSQSFPTVGNPVTFDLNGSANFGDTVTYIFTSPSDYVHCNTSIHYDITYTAGGGATTTTTSLDSFGLWGTIASSTGAMVSSSMPFWIIVLGMLFAFFVLFFLASGLSRSLKALLRH